MDKQELVSLINTYAQLKAAIERAKPDVPSVMVTEQIEVENHTVMDTSLRQDKTVTTDNGVSVIAVSRLPIPFQKQIVDRAVGFLLGNPIQIAGTANTPEEVSIKALMQKVWDDNKMDYDTKSLFRTLLEEGEAAELWYTEQITPDYWAGTANQGKTVRMRSFLLARSRGDNLFPVFDNYGDLIAFGRQYFLTVESQKVEHFDIYTDDTIYYAQVGLNGEWIVSPKQHTLGKIPIIYYYQPKVDWADVQDLIDRLEISLSNHADSNDYFGSPLIAVIGKIKSFAKKGEQGKVIELENNADIKTVSWAQAPESIKLEQTNLKDYILEMSDTPNISFSAMKGLGTYSGIALKMLFLAAHMKASNNEEIFGKGVQRRLNLIKFLLTRINNQLINGLSLSIKPEFTYYLPKDDKETLTNIQTAIAAGIMSTETGIELNPLIKNVDVEKKRIKAEEKKAADAAAIAAAAAKPQPQQ